MSFSRSLLVVIALSVLGGAALWVLARVSFDSQNAGQGGYAVLITAEAVPDRKVRELLAPWEQDFGGPPVSESSQWVLLDEFGSLARIPLDEYADRVAPYDPRNDGFAGRLRSFFVRDGNRYVFIPLKRGAGSDRAFEERLAAALGDISFSLEYLGLGAPVGLYLALFGAASAGVALVWLTGRRRPGIEQALPCLPVLAPLARYGAPGFALAALLAGIAALPGQRRSPAAPLAAPGALLLAGGALVVYCTGIAPLFALAVFAACMGICILARWTFSLPRFQGHNRFIPVLILRPRLKTGMVAAGKILLVMLPFALAIPPALLLPPRPVPSAALSGPAFAPVTEAEYRSHLEFQSGFSRRPLGSQTGQNYPAYELAPDGLVKPAEAPPGSIPPLEFPPFPLKGLMDFLGTP